MKSNGIRRIANRPCIMVAGEQRGNVLMRVGLDLTEGSGPIFGWKP